MGYGLTADDIFWRKHGIITKPGLRDSEDEEIIADIITSIIFGEPFPSISSCLQLLFSFLALRDDLPIDQPLNQETLFFTGQMAAAAAIAASLIYVGIQIRRSRVQAENEAMDAITNARAGFTKMLSEHNELSFIIPKGLSSKARMNPNEYFRFHSYLYVLFVDLELGFIKWKRKDISDELWRGWDEAIRWWLKFPNVQKWWKTSVVGGFTDEFKAYVNNVIESTGGQSSDAFEKELLFLELAGNKKSG